VVIFKSHLRREVFQVQEPFKQVIGLCRGGIDVKNGFCVLTIKGSSPLLTFLTDNGSYFTDSLGSKVDHQVG